MRIPTKVVRAATRISSQGVATPNTSKPNPRSTFRGSKVPSGLFSPRTTALEVPPSFRAGPRTRFFLIKSPQRTLPRTCDRPPAGLSSSMLNWVQILSTPTADTPGTCLLLHHENRRYLFGHISEGTQRLMVQRKVSLGKAEEIFLTGPVNWRNAGGLLGMVLSIADIVKSAQAAQAVEAQKKQKKKPFEANVMSSLSVHGGQNLTHLLATARRFVFRKGLPIKPHETTADPRETNKSSTEPDWQDSNLKVWKVPVFAGPPPRPASRKRSHDEMDAGRNGDGTTPAQTSRQILDSIVKHMFDSDWQFDALIETTLLRAKLPAKLFVKDEHGHLKQYDGPLPGEGKDVPDIPVLIRKPWPGSQIHALPPTEPAQQSMCYIVKNHSRRGKFNPQEAERRGVPRTLFKKLTSGESVPGKDGAIVTPEMVLGETIEGSGFAVVDIPDSSYVDAFLARPEWTDVEIMRGVEVMFWLLGPGIANDSRIVEFMEKHSTMKHSISSTDTCPNLLALGSPAAAQIRLHRIDPDRFSLQQFSNLPPSPPDSPTSSVEPARPGWTMQLAPQVRVQDDKVVPLLDTLGALKELDKEVVDLADAARARISDLAFLDRLEKAERDIPNRDMEVIPLGTGSALPSKYRNVSATLIRIPGVGSYLFDAGENTLGSLQRLFGYDTAAQILKDLRAIWISHLHADHHLGTASVIRAWRDATAAHEDTKSNRLVVASATAMLGWLREYADVEDYGYDRLRTVDLDPPAYPVDVACTPFIFDDAETREFGLARIDAARVDHCYGAMAAVLTWPSGLRVAYSGDCRPSEAFVAIGRNATLLIHESTFDDELTGEALAKKHSTMAEALGVGRRMGARRVLLTHFSQRYPKIPVFDVEEHGGGSRGGEGDAVGQGKEEDGMVALMAFDQMRVKLGDFRKAAAFLPALQKLFEEGEE